MTATVTVPVAGDLTWFGDSRPASKKPLRTNVFESMMNHQGMQQQKELFRGNPGSVVDNQELGHVLLLAGTPRR